MRYLILSDIHANLEALDAVLAAAPAWDRALILGDLVGYGADPNAVVERVRALPTAALIRGNHDKVAAGLTSVEGFNQLARQAIQWTATELTPDNLAWLAALPAGPAVADDLVEICHGTPFDEDVYLFDDLDAEHAVETQRRRVCLFGHTHVPAAFAGIRGIRALPIPRGPRSEIAIEAETRYLINCGAVGQPRDNDPRAACGLLDVERRTVEILRMPYDVLGAQTKILAAGLPPVLAQRLAAGR
jgi:diadenosine tetraphosphatase ApaH/serine/threonine PP2A family protein phosphatase